MKKLIIIFTILLTNNIAALELTLKVNYWLQELRETYTVHTDEYIYLDNDNDTILSDVLESSPSFNAVRSGPAGQQTSLFTRGTNSNHTLVTINGSPITDHSTTNGLTDLGLINTNFANSLHLVKGPMSTLYGANAVGGVIDIQTEKKFINTLTASYGSNSKTKFGFDSNFGDQTEFNIGIYTENSEGISIYPEGDESDGYDLLSYNFGYRGSLNETDYELIFLNTEQDTDLDGSGADDLDYTANTKFNFFQLKSNTDSKYGKINLIVDHNRWDRDYLNGTEVDTYDSSTSHIKIVDTFKNHKFSNSIGLDYYNYTAKFNNTGSYNSSVDKKAFQSGLFNNTDFKISKNILLSGGFRIDENSRHGSQDTYRIGTSYNIENINLYSSAATAYKNPTMYEMYGADSYGYTGNSDLKPETSINRELGIKYSLDNGIITATVYETDIKDMISYGNSTYSNDSDGISKMQGVDIGLNYEIGNFYFFNSYAHVHAVNSSDTWLKRRPHDLLYSGFKYSINNLWIKPSINYYGVHSDTHSSTYATIQVKERTLADLSIGYKGLSIDIKNVFDDKYSRPHGYNQGGLEAEIKYEMFF